MLGVLQLLWKGGLIIFAQKFSNHKLVPSAKGGETVKICDKLRRLRLQRGLTQEELADRCELSKSFISLLERDLTSPSLDTLSDLLETLGSDLPTFFREKDEKLVFGGEDIFVKEDPDGLRGMIRWLIPSAQKNQMEPILVEMAPGGETQEDDPHEGEEFGYVLAGTIRIVLGDRSEPVWPEALRTPQEIAARGLACRNPKCIGKVEQELAPAFVLAGGRYRCLYCESDAQAALSGGDAPVRKGKA